MNAAPVFNKTRIAPTPSGFLHLGNALSFALTAALARKANAKILLRIDDLDQQRATDAYLQDIFDTLHFLEIPWQEGPEDAGEFKKKYSQVHRLPLYNEALQQLREGGHVFACTCSRADLLRHSPEGVYPGTCLNKGISPDEKDASWRLRTSAVQELQVKTWQGKPIKTVLPASMQYFVVRKKDGFPAYQLASLIDDLHYAINLVVRGEDLWPSTLAQHYLATLLGQQVFLNAHFYHHSLLLGPDDQKLSKSAGATSIQYLRKQGKTAADIYSMIAKMG